MTATHQNSLLSLCIVPVNQRMLHGQPPPLRLGLSLDVRGLARLPLWLSLACPGSSHGDLRVRTGGVNTPLAVAVRVCEDLSP